MKNITRREFLKATAAGSLSVAASSLLGISAFGEEAIYKPGVYTASSDGIGIVTVTMKFSETKILDCIVDTSKETDGIGKGTGEGFAERILSAQSFDVDGVSGATLTSEAVKRAAENCIAQAS